MKRTIEKNDKYLLVRVQEEKLNSLVAPELKAEFVFQAGQGVKNMIIDLSDVQYCDSSGLSAILVGNRLCRNSNGSFIVSCVQDSVKKLIAISQLEQVLQLTPTVNEGIGLVSSDELERSVKDKE